jgi:hypothetical protein
MEEKIKKLELLWNESICEKHKEECNNANAFEKVKKVCEMYLFNRMDIEIVSIKDNDECCRTNNVNYGVIIFDIYYRNKNKIYPLSYEDKEILPNIEMVIDFSRFSVVDDEIPCSVNF